MVWPAPVPVSPRYARICAGVYPVGLPVLSSGTPFASSACASSDNGCTTPPARWTTLPFPASPLGPFLPPFLAAFSASLAAFSVSLAAFLDGGVVAGVLSPAPAHGTPVTQKIGDASGSVTAPATPVAPNTARQPPEART